MIVISNSHLPPKVESPRTPLENLVSPSLNPNTSLEVLHTNPLGEPSVLGRQHTARTNPSHNAIFKLAKRAHVQEHHHREAHIK